MFFLMAVMSTIAWLWLIVSAFKENKVVWGIVMILFSPACIIYGLINWNKNLIPLIILIISILYFINLDPEELEAFVDPQESAGQFDQHNNTDDFETFLSNELERTE
ncbi:hypothetical protein [Endozoicomonas elysicola]|uniref:hypothetical protein n=1 Tax=Endozoicomonas elysicola TaxID=305900 RepID=UPI00037AA017|nr:hypothetical protein [Endozoicomonas elysicola]